MNASSARAIRLILVDPQPAVRKGLRMRFALEPEMEVVGEASDVAEALSAARTMHPDVILMDLELPGTDGLSATEVLCSAVPQSAVVIFTLRDDASTRERARAAGAAAFVAKHQTEETLLAEIWRAVSTQG